MTADALSATWSSQARLTNAAARDALMAAGAGRSAAYDALKLEGRFAGRLTEAEGLLSWK